jgi:3-hydroxyacyl-[acyl-carrier-protein] dehydratase
LSGFSLNSVQLQEYLHSRYPFLMIDHVDEVIPGISARGFKNVTLNEWFFQKGSSTPRMPETVQIEALEEMLALTVLTIPGNKEMTPRFLSASVKFIDNVLVGDKFIIETTVLSWRRGILNGTAIGSVNGNVVCEAKLMVTIPNILNNYSPPKIKRK